MASPPSTSQRRLLHSKYQAQLPLLVPTQGRRIQRLLAVAGAEGRRRDIVGTFKHGFLAPYIRRLPRPEEMHCTIFWSDDELELIRQSSVYQETINQRSQIEKELLEIRTIRIIVRTYFQALRNNPEMSKSITYKDLMHAYALGTDKIRKIFKCYPASGRWVYTFVQTFMTSPKVRKRRRGSASGYCYCYARLLQRRCLITRNPIQQSICYS